jgi:hypothetical protein
MERKETEVDAYSAKRVWAWASCHCSIVIDRLQVSCLRYGHAVSNFSCGQEASKKRIESHYGGFEYG